MTGSVVCLSNTEQMFPMDIFNDAADYILKTGNVATVNPLERLGIILMSMVDTVNTEGISVQQTEELKSVVEVCQMAVNMGK
jgi:hypothetical protein